LIVISLYPSFLVSATPFMIGNLQLFTNTQLTGIFAIPIPVSMLHFIKRV
jgi:hypothetical protein